MAKNWLIILVILLVLWLLARRSNYETRDVQDDQNTARFQQDRFVFDGMI